MPFGDGRGPAGPRRNPKAGNFGGRNQGPVAGGPQGKCRCPNCGYEQEHRRGVPCNKIKCPKCGTLLARQ